MPLIRRNSNKVSRSQSDSALTRKIFYEDRWKGVLLFQSMVHSLVLQSPDLSWFKFLDVLGVICGGGTLDRRPRGATQCVPPVR
jgi:hypothetical protein